MPSVVDASFLETFKEKLDQALDQIRKKFGDDAVMRAAFLKKEEKDPKEQG